MAIGFTPKHIESYHLNGLTPSQFLVISIDAAIALGWKITYISNSGIIAHTDKGMFTWNAEVSITIDEEKATIKSSSAGNDMMDFGKNKKTVNQFISQLEIIKSEISLESIDSKYDLLKDNLAPEEEDILKLPPPTTYEQFQNILAIFKPTTGFFVTPIIININILIFVLMVITGVSIFDPNGESLLLWGANYRPMTLEGEWWRLLTNVFIHIGILHLLLNMYALLYIGILLEPILGKARFASAYLLSGISASVVSLWWYDLTISAGASGAIFGMYGVFLAMLSTNLIEKSERKSLLTSISIFVGYNLLYGIKGGIDNAAHIGGLIGGLIIGYAFMPSIKSEGDNRLKITTITIVTVLILGISYASYKNIPNDIGKYENKMKSFVSMEAMALEIYNLPENTPKEEVLHEIQEKGLYYWHENVALIESFKEMNLPNEIEKRNEMLLEYCQLRIKSYELLYKAISEDSDKYKDELDKFNLQIENIINKINILQ